MAVFAQVFTEKCVQVCDKIRIDATKSFASLPDTLTEVETVSIDPGDGGGFIEIDPITNTSKNSRDWILDWQYNTVVSTDGFDTNTITVQITATGGRTITKTQDIEVRTEAYDKLFSCDQDLMLHEADIMCMLPDGKSSWNFLHRRTQNRILEWLDQEGYTLCTGERVTKDQVIEPLEMREWSIYKTLELIFEMNSNAIDDKFAEKSKHYCQMKNRSRHKYLRGIDWNKSGVLEVGEEQTHQVGFTEIVRNNVGRKY